jgi:outer membrane protein assembly factor BamB
MTAGIDTDSEVDVDPLRDYYGCYNLMEIPESIRPIIAENEENQNVPKLENTVNSKKSHEPLIGPMDSAWPMYCHDLHHTSRSPYSTADNSFFNKWWYKCYDYIEGSGVIDNNGVIYFGSRDEELDRYFFAVYPNGTLKWKCLINGLVESSPAIGEDGTIYVGIESPWDGLIAINPDGTIKWRYKGGCVISSPMIGDDGIIYYGVQSNSNPPKGAFIALYPNGTLKWRYNTDHVVYSSPVIGDDGTFYCGCHDTYLYALYPNNGTVKWRYKTGGWIRVSPCIGDDGILYCVSLDGGLHAVYPNNGTRKWKTEVGAGTSPTIGQDGTIYAGYSKLYAVNSDGSVKWTFSVGGTMRGGTPCNSIDGTIFVGTSDGGKIIAINPDGTERWRTKIGTCEFAPIIGEDGTVYVGTSDKEYVNPNAVRSFGYLYAFNNMNPDAPSAPVIEGPANGGTKKSYDYNFKSTSPLGNDVYYYVDWNDGDWRRDCWVGPYGSGEEAVISHTWSYPGTYTIRTRCKDTDNLWSDWSEKSVSIPRFHC